MRSQVGQAPSSQCTVQNTSSKTNYEEFQAVHRRALNQAQVLCGCRGPMPTMPALPGNPGIRISRKDIQESLHLNSSLEILIRELGNIVLGFQTWQIIGFLGPSPTDSNGKFQILLSSSLPPHEILDLWNHPQGFKSHLHHLPAVLAV